MPAPQNTGNLSPEEYEKLWGPPQTADGFYTRDEFYDQMVKNGWDREGDQQFIAALYKIAAACGDVILTEDIAGQPAQSDEGRNDLCERVLEYADGLYDDVTAPLKEEVSFIRERTVTAEQRRRMEEERRRQEELERLRAEGAKSEAESQARKRREEERRLQDEADRIRIAEEERLRQEEYERWEKERAERERREAEERLRQQEEQRLEEERSREYVQKETARREAEERERLRQEQAERGYKEQMQSNRAMRERRERSRLNEEDEIRRTQTVRELLKRAVDLGLDKVKPGNVKPNWGTGIDPELPPDERLRLEEEFNKANPELARKIAHVEDSRRLLYDIYMTLNDPANRDFVKAAKRGAFYETTPLKLKLMQAYPDKSPHAMNQLFGMAEKLGSMKLKNAGELCDKKNLDDPFWKYNDKDGAMTEAQASQIKKKFNELEEDGFPWAEFMDSPARDNFRRSMKMKGWDPMLGVYRIAQGPKEEAKVREVCGAADARLMLEQLDALQALYAKKGGAICDVGAEDLAIWLDSKGYDILENSLAFGNVEEATADGKPVLKIGMAEDNLDDKVDRDIMDDKSYKKTLDAVKEAQQFFRQNKDFLEHAFGVLHAYRNGTGYALKDANDELKKMEASPSMMKKLNQFRTLIHRSRQAYDTGVCKLTDKQNKPVMVEPLKEDTIFDKKTVTEENEVLDTCYDMLNEASKQVSRNSSEYNSVKKSILNIQKVLSKQYPDNEAARQAYVKAVNKALNNINTYRMHKAVDGVKDDGTRYKLLAVERVDKLLRTRYKSIEQRDYEDSLGAVSELFKTEVPEGVTGDKYVYEKAMGKIRNMKKAFEDYNRQIAEENGISRRNSFSAGKTGYALGDADESIRRTGTLGGIRPDKLKMKKDGKEIALKPAPQKGSELVRPSHKKETDYRKKLDPKDAYGKEKLVSSAERSLYLDAMETRVKKESRNPQEEETRLKQQVRDYEKNGSIRYRAFKFENLTDKDFNKEFQKNVLAGAEQKKVSAQDIRNYRDDALRKCYTQYKGKNVAELDKLSETLGSKVNSKTIALEQQKKNPQLKNGGSAPTL